MTDRDKERMPTAIIYCLLTDCILIAPATAFVGLFQKKKENLAFGIRIKFWLHIQNLCDLLQVLTFIQELFID